MKHFIFAFLLLAQSVWAQQTPPDAQSDSELPLRTLEQLDLSKPHNFIQLRNGEVIPMIGEAETEEEKRIFDSLTPDEQTRFLKRKNEMLTELGNALFKKRNLAIIGSVMNAGKALEPAGKAISAVSKVVFTSVAEFLKWAHIIKPKMTVVEKLESNRRLYPPLRSQVKAHLHVTETGREAIHAMLEGFDSQMWKDAKNVANATATAYTAFVGLSTGAALGERGFYRMIGLEVDFGADFQTQQKFVKFHILNQKLDKAVFVVESSFLWGIFKSFYNHQASDAPFISMQLPGLLAYRKGPEYVGVGINSGVSFILLASALTMTYGDPTLGAIMLGTYKLLTFSSLFWTQADRKQLMHKNFYGSCMRYFH